MLGEGSLELAASGFRVVDNYGATIITTGIDVKVMSALANDMRKSGNLLGRYKITAHNGRQYIIFQGNHRLRNIVRETRYRISNPTVIKMGIGPHGLKAAAKGGVYIALFVSAGVNSIAWIFDENYGWKDFLSNMAEDAVKAVLAGLAGYFAGKIVALVFGSAFIAYTAGAFVTGVVGFGLMSVGPEDIEEFARKSVILYRQSLSMIDDPQAYLKYGIKRVEDAAYCTSSAAGTLILEAAQRTVRDRVNQLMRRISPFNVH